MKRPRSKKEDTERPTQRQQGVMYTLAIGVYSRGHSPVVCPLSEPGYSD